MQQFRRITAAVSHILDRFAAVISCSSIALLFIVVIIQIFMRYFLKHSLIWGEELPRYLMICAIFIGASCAVKRANLIQIELFRDLLPRRARMIAIYASLICSIIFLLLVIIFGFRHTFSPMILRQVSPALRIPMAIPYSLVPCGILLTLIQLIARIILVDTVAKGDTVADKGSAV